MKCIFIYLHRFFRYLIRLVFKNKRVSKPLLIYPDLNIEYTVAQHLLFFFSFKINYEHDIQIKILSLIKKGDIVFDLGANIGQYSLIFSKLVGPSGHVYSFEPNLKVFSDLNINIKKNNLNNISTFNYAIGSKNERNLFFVESLNGGRGSSFKKERVAKLDSSENYFVDVKNLDYLITKFGVPNFVKIDVEGLELDVLLGISVIPEKTIFLIELTKYNKNEIFLFFRSHNFGCFSSSGILINDPNNIFAKNKNFGNYFFKNLVN